MAEPLDEPSFSMRRSASSNRIISSPIFARARGPGQRAFLGIIPRLQPAGPLFEKDALPALELMGRHLALARDRVERLAAQESQDQLRLPLDAPALREGG